MAYGTTLTDMKKLVPEHIGVLTDLLTDAGILLKLLPFENIPEGFDPPIPTMSGASGIAFRDFNATYADSAEGVGSVAERIRMFGRTLKIDKAMSAQGLAEKAAQRARAYAYRMGLKFIDTFVNGDITVDTKAFDGIKKRCVDGTRETAAGANGGAVTVDLLDDLIQSVSGAANIVLCNRRAHGFVKKLAQAQTHKVRFEWTSLPGLTERVMTFDGVPFLPIWENDNGVAVIPDDEIQGTAEDCTSYYALKLGNGLVRGLQGKAEPGAAHGLFLGPIEHLPGGRVFVQEMEWVAGLAVPSNNFIYRLKGVNAA